MVEPRSPFLPTKEELKELDAKDGFDRTRPKPVVKPEVEESVVEEEVDE